MVATDASVAAAPSVLTLVAISIGLFIYEVKGTYLLVTQLSSGASLAEPLNLVVFGGIRPVYDLGFGPRLALTPATVLAQTVSGKRNRVLATSSWTNNSPQTPCRCHILPQLTDRELTVSNRGWYAPQRLTIDSDSPATFVCRPQSPTA